MAHDGDGIEEELAAGQYTRVLRRYTETVEKYRQATEDRARTQVLGQYLMHSGLEGVAILHAGRELAAANRRFQDLTLHRGRWRCTSDPEIRLEGAVGAALVELGR